MEVEDLPPVTASPCSDCPWRINSLPGWLGPLDATEWIGLVLSDAPIACHQTIVKSGEWTPGVRQCAGAADFRANICKVPRDHNVAGGSPNDAVLMDVQAFLEHHTGHNWGKHSE